jgi:hypothetical protein
MRLGEDRVQNIATKMAEYLTREKIIQFGGMRTSLVTAIARVIMNDLKIEDEINAEVERMIESMKRPIPRGSAEWNSIFFQKKEELARRRNYII